MYKYKKSRKDKRGSNKNIFRNISLSVLMSYLAILIIPIISMILIYTTSYKIMLQLQKEKISSKLSDYSISLDRQLEEAYNVGVYVCQNNDLISLCKMENGRLKRIKFYDWYKLSQDFPNYSLTNKIIKDVYIFMDNQDYVLKPPVVMPVSDIYSIMDNIGDITYEETIDMLTAKKQYKAFHVITDNQTGQKSIIMVQTVPYETSGKPLGAVVVQIDYQWLQKLMGDMATEDNGVAIIYDGNGTPITIQRGKGSGSDIDKIYELAENNKIDDIKQIDSNKYIYCKKELKSAKWTVLMVAPKSVLIQRMGSMRYMTIILCLLSVAVSLVICFFMWARRLKVLKEYSNCINSLYGMGQCDCESHGFWNGLHYLLDNVDKLRETLRVKDNLLKDYVLQKALYYEYQDREHMAKELKEADVEIRPGSNYVAVLNLQPGDPGQCPDNNDIIDFIKRFLSQNENLGYMIYPLKHYTFAIILIGQEKGNEDQIRGLLNKLRSTILSQCSIQSYIGISDVVSSDMELHRGFLQASNVCDYLKYYNIGSSMFEKDISENDNYFYFPVEVEIYYLKAFKKGTLEDLNNIINKIIEENIENRRLSISMLRYLTELVRYTSIRVIRDSKLENMNDYVENIEASDTIRDIFAKVIEAKQCQEADVKTSTNDENNKTREQMKQYIYEKYTSPEFNISDLAAYFNISECKAYSEVKKMLGVTFSEYVENMRINKACSLLKDGFKVKEVAQLSGYYSDYSFRRAFKRVMGMAPSDYMSC